ncbi:MAG: hypothetical protein ACO3UU_10075, partial [Minisyncoccia bacterium]
VEVEENIVSGLNSKIEYTLPSLFNTYDESYYLAIYESVDGERADIVVEDNLEVMRPYLDPNSLGTTASEKAEYIYLEGLARAIIDSIVPGGFYYERSWYETTGNNTDFMPVWDRTYKILKAYENNELVWDSSQTPSAIGQWNYLLTKDKTAIIKDWVQQEDSYIRQVGSPKGVPLAESDSYYLYDTEDSTVTFAVAPGVTFPMGWNYLFSLETGYKVVPFDIKDAITMLIDDLKCGRMEYHKRYITSYNTDQYKIQIDKSALEGTGNILVDKILQKYITNFGTPGVL